MPRSRPPTEDIKGCCEGARNDKTKKDQSDGKDAAYSGEIIYCSQNFEN
jgi:hypothetical protein